MNKRLALGVMVALGLGCGDDDGDDSKKNAPEKCRMVFDALCEKAAACRVDSGESVSMQDAVDQCLETIKDQGYDCDEAVRAPSDIDQCFKEIDSAACQDLAVQDNGMPANVPASCIQ